MHFSREATERRKRRIRQMTVEDGKRRRALVRRSQVRARDEREREREKEKEEDDTRDRERKGGRGKEREKERGPGAGPPGLLLREGGSSESIRTVSPADTHPRPTPLSARRPVRRLVRGTPTGRPTTFSAAPQFSPLFPFITREEEEWVGRPRRRERPSLFLSYPSPRPSSTSSSFSFRLPHPPGSRSYDLHPSCLAELPSFSPSDSFLPAFPRPLTYELDLLETRAASNAVFPSLLILTAPFRSRLPSSIRRPSFAFFHPLWPLPSRYFSSFL